VSSRGAHLEKPQRLAHGLDGQLGLDAGDLAVHVERAVDEGSEHLLHRCARVGADVAWVPLGWRAALHEAEPLGLVAVEAGKLVDVAWVDDLHAIVYVGSRPAPEKASPFGTWDPGAGAASGSIRAMAAKHRSRSSRKHGNATSPRPRAKEKKPHVKQEEVWALHNEVRPLIETLYRFKNRLVPDGNFVEFVDALEVKTTVSDLRYLAKQATALALTIESRANRPTDLRYR